MNELRAYGCRSARRKTDCAVMSPTGLRDSGKISDAEPRRNGFPLLATRNVLRQPEAVDGLLRVLTGLVQESHVAHEATALHTQRIAIAIPTLSLDY